jgi:hypothetical protein
MDHGPCQLHWEGGRYGPSNVSVPRFGGGERTIWGQMSVLDEWFLGSEVGKGSEVGNGEWGMGNGREPYAESPME